MKSPYIARAALLLPLLLSGCDHKQKAANQATLAPPIEDKQPSKPDKAPTNLPPPVITVPAPDQPAATNTPPPPPAPKPKPHHKPKPDPGTQIAANTPPPAVSAVGNLSSGEPADLRKQTDDTISQTERGLNGITRPLNDQEKKTGTQIREFLKQARAALTTGDIDGAHTLAQKAKVLLGELTPP